MSQENVEIVRHMYALLTRGDPAVAELVAPDFVLDFSRRLIDPFVFRTRDELRSVLEREEWRETWSGWPTWDPEELIDAGDKVLAFIRFGGRGKASGVEVDVRIANLWTFRDGTPVEVKYYGEDRSSALEAAGLPE